MMHLTYGMFLALLALLICHAATITAFLPTQQVQQRANTPPFRSSICAQTAKQDEQNQMNQNSSNKKNFQRNQKRNRITIGDLKKEILRNPSTLSGTAAANKSKKNKRTRRKVENPQQKYVYAAQRIKLEKRKVDDVEGNNNKNDDHDDDTQECSASSQVSSRYMEEARRMGLTNPLGQHCDPLVDTIEPELVGRIRVGEEENGSGTYAYIINKPQGWSILGGTASSSGASNKQKKNDQAISKTQGGKSTIRRVKIMNSRGKEEFLEFDEADVMALLSPEERAEIESRGGSIFDFSGPIVDDEADFTSNLPGWYDVENMTPDERKEAGIEKEDYDPSDILDFDEADIVALLSPEELLEYEADKKSQINRQALSPAQNVIERYEGIAEEELDPSVVENLKRIKTRLNSLKDDASFSFVPRPSIVSWLKDMKAAEGSPIRGGNFWTALAGASEVDDTGLVLLAPKEKSESIFVEFAEYISVVGTGNYLNNKAGKVSGNDFPIESVKIDMISRLKRNREGDTTQTIRIVVSEHPSTCAGIIAHAQNQFEDGIRGDPAANVFDRRAPRRLIHCASMAVSSLLFDDTVEAEAGLPDDIAILSERLNNHKFLKGSFLGRQSLRENPLTTAYREINGAADGFPGWTIDR
jgi:phosphoglycolate phosphatase-like HAD superfamily hydrolase